mmetsp:Transcript_8629/g.23679  ORF Transcript_8629/g.23679 Transcript_8629/m.23679 type:complete len:317 (-) Transcript_8629:45-995(-)
MGLFNRNKSTDSPAMLRRLSSRRKAPAVEKTASTASENPLGLTGSERETVLQLRTATVDVPSPLLMPLDDLTLIRYARARNCDAEKARAMLEDTLHWRKHFGADEVHTKRAELRHEGETGKTFVADFLDREGRPVIIMRPANENTRSHGPAIQHLVYTLERAISLMREDGPQKLVLLIDYKGYSLRNAPAMKTSRETLHILQSHYPERLGKAMCVDAPWLFSSVYNALQPFIDPETKKKIAFVSTTTPKGVQALHDLVDPDDLEPAFGGRRTRPIFDADAYFDPAQDPLVAKAEAVVQASRKSSALAARAGGGRAS